MSDCSSWHICYHLIDPTHHLLHVKSGDWEALGETFNFFLPNFSISFSFRCSFLDFSLAHNAFAFKAYPKAHIHRARAFIQYSTCHVILYIYARSRALSLSLTQLLSLALSRSLSCSLFHSLSSTLPPSRSQSLSLAQFLSLSLARTLPLPPPISQKKPKTDTYIIFKSVRCS